VTLSLPEKEAAPATTIGFDNAGPNSLLTRPSLWTSWPKSVDAGYLIHSFTRDDDPARAIRVEQIQGEAYVAAGYVQQCALDSVGRLDNSDSEFILDKARGSNRLNDVLYLHAIPLQPAVDRRNEGGLRVVSVTDAGSLDDLGAFAACKDSIDPQHRRKLYDAFDRLGPRGVKEITALSLTQDASHIVSYALIREALRHALHDQTDELWLITFAMPGYLAMRKKFGAIGMPQIGKPFYAHRNADPRTSNDLLLVPSIVQTPKFFDVIARSAVAETHPAAAAKHFATLRFMAAGLDDHYFTPLVRQALRAQL
jgi:hypothetical protein